MTPCQLTAFAVVPLILASAPLPAQAADTPAALGARIAAQGSPSGAPACAACHGVQLHGTPALKAPGIAGLSSAFILSRLDHYAGPQGHNPSMKQVATSLTPAERKAVAAYLAGLRP